MTVITTNLFRRGDQLFGNPFPNPPQTLSDPARTLWDEIVTTYPPYHFRQGATYLLESFVHLAIEARRLAEIGLENPHILRQHIRAVRAMVHLASVLRLLPR